MSNESAYACLHCKGRIADEGQVQGEMVICPYCGGTTILDQLQPAEEKLEPEPSGVLIRRRDPKSPSRLKLKARDESEDNTSRFLNAPAPPGSESKHRTPFRAKQPPKKASIQAALALIVGGPPMCSLVFLFLFFLFWSHKDAGTVLWMLLIAAIGFFTSGFIFNKLDESKKTILTLVLGVGLAASALGAYYGGVMIGGTPEITIADLAPPRMVWEAGKERVVYGDGDTAQLQILADSINKANSLSPSDIFDYFLLDKVVVDLKRYQKKRVALNLTQMEEQGLGEMRTKINGGGFSFDQYYGNTGPEYAFPIYSKYLKLSALVAPSTPEIQKLHNSLIKASTFQMSAFSTVYIHAAKINGLKMDMSRVVKNINNMNREPRITPDIRAELNRLTVELANVKLELNASNEAQSVGVQQLQVAEEQFDQIKKECRRILQGN